MNITDAIERKLGRKLDPADRGRISDLNNIPRAIVEQAKALDNPILAQSLLAFYTSPECHSFLKRYTQEVIFGNASPNVWRRGRILVPSLSINEQLCQPTADILKPLGGDFEARIVPRLEAWRAGVSWVGAPARAEPNADYRSPVPDGAASLESAVLEPVKQRTVTVRRWIACRLACVLSASGRLSRIRNISDLAAGLPPLELWSEDARIGAHALLRENRELGYSENEVSGFRGPESWFEDEL